MFNVKFLLSKINGKVDLEYLLELNQPKEHLTNKTIPGKPIDNTTMVIKVAGHEYCVTNKPKRHSRSLSLGSISDLVIEVEKTKIDKAFYNSSNSYNNNCATMECKNKFARNDTNECDNKENVCNNGGADVESLLEVNRNNVNDDKIGKDTTTTREKRPQQQHKKLVNKQQQQQSVVSNKRSAKGQQRVVDDIQRSGGHQLSKSKSEGNPFQHKKRGKVVKVNRPITSRGKIYKSAWCNALRIDALFNFFCLFVGNL